MEKTLPPGDGSPDDGAPTDEAPPFDERPPQAEASPPAPATGPLAAAAAERWDEIGRRLQSYSAPAAAMLRDGQPTNEREGRLTIAVGAQFNRDKLAEPATAALVAGAIAEVLGRPVTVAFEVDATLLERQPVVEDRSRGLTIDEAIALSREKLGARLLDEESGP